MKARHFLFLSMASIFMLGACSSEDVVLEENENIDDIQIIVDAKKEPVKGLDKLPKWLETVALAMHQAEGIEIYSFDYQGATYVYVLDLLDSCWTCGRRYFTATGEEIVFGGDPDDATDLYVILDQCETERTEIFSVLNL